MNKLPDSECLTSCDVPDARQLNQNCYCKTLDRDRLDQILGADEDGRDLLAARPQLFSNIATFISAAEFQAIADSVQAIERIFALPSYQRLVLSRPGQPKLHAPANAGVFMGYDFHLHPDGPRLIEINTNAGGAFLNAMLLGAQRACCPPMQVAFAAEKEKLYREFVEMFRNEWRLQRGDRPLQRIAIVDQQPHQQYLFPEFQIAQRVFQAHGMEAVIADAEDLTLDQTGLRYQGQIIDLVYNRLTDFALAAAANRALDRAYRADAVVVTPAPFHHAIHADKRNLELLSDAKVLEGLGVNETDRALVATAVPVTRGVTEANAEDLWHQRRQLFFKPVAGYGGKATYRGDKLTKRVWEEILRGQYVAQQQVAPSERGIMLDDQVSSLKMDIRAYAYQGRIQLLAARLYQGQTTNFRTPGGGFSPVFIY